MSIQDGAVHHIHLPWVRVMQYFVGVNGHVKVFTKNDTCNYYI